MKGRLTIFLLTFALLLFSSCVGLPGKVFDTFEKKINENYSIRVTGYQVSCIGICDVDYVIESINNKSGFPNKILYESRNGDPREIHGEYFVVKNENLAYFWWGYTFGITTDGGENWETFNTLEYLQRKNLPNYREIEKVEIYPDGTGEMQLKKDWEGKNKIKYLITKDFGKSWIAIKPTEPKPPKNIFNK